MCFKYPQSSLYYSDFPLNSFLINRGIVKYINYPSYDVFARIRDHKMIVSEALGKLFFFHIGKVKFLEIAYALLGQKIRKHFFLEYRRLAKSNFH